MGPTDDKKMKLESFGFRGLVHILRCVLSASEAPAASRLPPRELVGHTDWFLESG